MPMTPLKIAIVCGHCGSVVEVEEVPDEVNGIDVLGLIYHRCGEDAGR